MSGFFFGEATDTQFTFGGNGVTYHNHGNDFRLKSRAPYFVLIELCGHRVARVEAVVDDFGNLFPVSIIACGGTA